MGHSGDQHPIVSHECRQWSRPTLAPSVTRILDAAAPGAAVRGEFKPEHKAVIQDDGAIPRAGIPEIPEAPALLRDGRRLWRFEADPKRLPLRRAVEFLNRPAGRTGREGTITPKAMSFRHALRLQAGRPTRTSRSAAAINVQQRGAGISRRRAVDHASSAGASSCLRLPVTRYTEAPRPPPSSPIRASILFTLESI